MDNLFIQDEADIGHLNWTKEGWEFLLQNNEFKELAIQTLSQILFIYQRVEFKYNNLYYEIFDSSNSGYIVNVYLSDQKDENGYYLEDNIVDCGLCTGSSKDAIEFML